MSVVTGLLSSSLLPYFLFSSTPLYLSFSLLSWLIIRLKLLRAFWLEQYWQTLCTSMSCCLAWLLCVSIPTACIKTQEYGLIIEFEVNMYYKINLDGDTAIPLIRGGDWRLIFNCKSNYMGQIASDV